LASIRRFESSTGKLWKPQIPL